MLYHERGYTQSVCRLLGSKACTSLFSRGLTVRIVSGDHCVHFAPERLSSRREPSPAFLEVLAEAAAEFLGFAVGSGGGNRDRRVPIFFLTCQIHCTLSGIGSPFCGFFPSGSGLGTSPIFLRGGGRGERWLFAPSILIQGDSETERCLSCSSAAGPRFAML